MSKISNKVIIIILLIIAVTLAAAIYNKNHSILSKNTTNFTPSNSLDKDLTADQKALFYSPQKDATKAELETFSQLVAKYATEGDTITVKDCVANPIVLHVVLGSTFTVKNTGSTDIHFGFQDERTLVKAGTSSKIKADYKNGAGIYGYGCDNTALNRSIGLLLISGK